MNTMMQMRDLPLEVVIEFVFPFLTNGELMHLRTLSHHLEDVLQRIHITTLTLNENRLANKFLCSGGLEALYRLLGKLENVRNLKGIRQVFDPEFVYNIAERLPKLRFVEDFVYMNRMRLVELCPEYETVPLPHLLQMSEEEISNLNIKRFKIGATSNYAFSVDDTSDVVKQLHYLEEIQCWWNSIECIWEAIKQERMFRIEHNKKELLKQKETQTIGEFYPENIRVRCGMDDVPNCSFCKEIPLIIHTRNIFVAKELAPYYEELIYSGGIKDLMLLVHCSASKLKELDLSRNEYDWIWPRNISLTSAKVCDDQKHHDLTMELFRKVIVQLLYRLKSLQVIKLSLPFNILVLFGNELKPNMSHYNLEKLAILDWIPSNFYASVNTYESRPQLILKKRPNSPLYEEPKHYEQIDFSILEPKAKNPAKRIDLEKLEHEPTGFGLFDDFWEQ